MTGGQRTVGLTRPDQKEAFRNARQRILTDVDEGVVDADTWGDDVPDGEIVRVLAEAYCGTLTVHADAIGDVAVDPDAARRDA